MFHRKHVGTKERRRLSRRVPAHCPVDDGISGADDAATAVALRNQLQDFFSKAGFELRKWNTSEPDVISTIPLELRERYPIRMISGRDHQYTKMLGIEWDMTTDSFHISVSEFQDASPLTKCMLLSNISKIFDVLGWLAPTVTTVKILLQKIWDAGGFIAKSSPSYFSSSLAAIM